VQGAFLSGSPDPRYSSLPLDTYAGNLKAAAAQYGGQDYIQSVNGVLGELNATSSSLSDLCAKVEQYAKEHKVTLEQAFEHLDRSDSAFHGLLESTHARLTAFTVKYAIARLYGPGGGKYDRKDSAGRVLTPTTIAKGVFGDKDALPPGQIAGYMAMDYAMNYIGRGLDISISGNRLLQKIGYGIDQKDAKVEMKIDGDPNKGRASVVLQVRVDKQQSLVEEDEGQMKGDIMAALAPVLEARNAYVAPGGIVFSENGQYRTYSVPIWRDFAIRSEQEANELSALIEVPATLYGPSSARNPALELRASTSDFGLPINKITRPEPGYFSFELQGGLSRTNLMGSRKQLTRGGAYDNASSIDNQLRHRDVSTGGIMDLFSMASYAPLEDFISARKATYFSDVNKSPYDWVGSGLLASDAAAFNTPANRALAPDAYLSAWKTLFDSNVDSYVQAGLGAGMAERILYDPRMAGVSPDFLDSIAKIEEWSPLHARLTYWSVYKGSILQNMGYTDPKAYPALFGRLQEELDYASARSISTPFNILAPSYLDGVRAQGDLYETYMRFNQAAKEQGLSAVLGFRLFGRENRLQVTVSQGLGPSDNQYFTQVITHPQSGMNVKISNGTMLLLDHLFNLYKYHDDKTLLRLDIHTQFNALLISNFQKYDYNADVQKAWSNPDSAQPGQPKGLFDVFYEHHDYPDQIVLSELSAAALSLQSKLLPGDLAGYELCQRLIDLCDPYQNKPDDWGTQVTNLILGAGDPTTREPGLRDIILSPMYLGGSWSDTEVSEGMYANGLDQYIGRDRLPFGGPIPTALIGLRYHFNEQESSLFGLLPALGVNPKKADLTLDLSGELFAPTAAVTGVASLFMDSKSVASQVAEQAPQVFKNWIPPVLFRADLSRTTDVFGWYAVQTGLYLGGNATGVKINDMGLYMKSLFKLPLSTTLYLNLTGRLNGTQLGELMPGYEAAAGTFTRVADNLQLGTQIYQMARDYPYGSTKSWGINIQFRYLFGDQPPAVSEPAARVNWYEWEQTNQKLYGVPAPKKKTNEQE
jgi:hypothetical protein